MECIVLAGGLGTRLRSSIGEAPKCMAPVNGRPFLHYIFGYLQQQGCTSVILSLGYKHEVVVDWLDSHQWPFEIRYVIEQEPLGTGGGLQLAMQQAREDDVIVLNGDTMFRAGLDTLLRFHQDHQAKVSLALKPMHHFDRYGVVVLDQNQRITSFEEKQFREEGLINGGIYVIDRRSFLARVLPQRFSFEKDYLEAFVGSGLFYGLAVDDYFIDIGVPEDYNKAQEDFKQLS